MKLTRRQEEFIVNLIELNRELDGPIHYSLLAERLGVSPFTAYDMLRVLEKKGMVSSEYQLAEGKSGPGRAERLFCPVMSMADRANRMGRKSGTAALDEAALKRILLEKLRLGDMGSKDAAEALMARVPPESPGGTSYCLEVLAAAVLRLRETTGQKILLGYLPQLLADSSGMLQNNLILLGGFALGLLAQEEATDDEWSQMLLAHVQQYQDIVIGMTTEEAQELAASLAIVFGPLRESLDLEPANV